MKSTFIKLTIGITATAAVLLFLIFTTNQITTTPDIALNEISLTPGTVTLIVLGSDVELDKPGLIINMKNYNHVMKENCNGCHGLADTVLDDYVSPAICIDNINKIKI